MAFRLPQALAALATFVPNPLVQSLLGAGLGAAVAPPPAPNAQLGRHAAAPPAAAAEIGRREPGARLPAALVGSLDFGRALQTSAASHDKKLERLAEKQVQELAELNRDGVKIRNPEALQAAFG